MKKKSPKSSKTSSAYKRRNSRLKKLQSILLEPTPHTVAEIRKMQLKDREAYLKRYEKDMAQDVAIVREKIGRRTQEQKFNERINKVLVPEVPKESSQTSLENIIRKIATEVTEEIVKRKTSVVEPKPPFSKPLSGDEKKVQEVLYRIHCILAKTEEPIKKLIEIIRETNKTSDIFQKPHTPIPITLVPMTLEQEIKAESDRIKDEEDIKKVINFADKNGISSVLHNFYPNEVTGGEVDIVSLSKYMTPSKKSQKRALKREQIRAKKSSAKKR